MNEKWIAILAFVIVLLTACSPTDLMDTAREFLPQVEEMAPELIEELMKSTVAEPVEEQPTPAVLTEQGLDETVPAEPAVDHSQPEDADSVLNITVTERTMQLESDDPLYEVQIRYPYLEGDSEAISPFNFEMDYLVEVELETFLNDVAEREVERAEGAMQAVSTLKIDYQMTYQEDGLFSVFLPISTYLAISAHPSTVSFSYNYDAVHQDFLMPRDLFSPDSDYFSVILTFVEAELSSRDFGYQQGVAEDVLLRRDNWNIMPEDLRINFDAYEVGPGALGSQQVLIPWESLTDLLDPAGPAGAMITP